MKSKILLLAMTILSLASCKKELIDTPTPGPGHGDEEYMLEVYEEGGTSTKSSPSTVQLNLANLVSASSKSITAQLKKRSGSNWINVDSDVSYSWIASSSDNQIFSGSGTTGQTCTVSAKTEGSGKINVSASISGSAVANQDVPVTVSDSRALSWSDATTSLTSGETKTAVLNSNFSCTATITSNNSNFLIGTAQNNLSSSATVTFTDSKTKTIYYKYTGSEETTVKIDAVNGDKKIKASLSVSVNEEEEIIIPSAVNISVFEEYAAGGNVKVTASADQVMQGILMIVIPYSIYNGTPTHYAAEQAGKDYREYLSTYQIGSMTVTLTIPQGQKEVSITVPVTAFSNNIAHLKRMAITTGQNKSGFDNVTLIPVRDFSFDSDLFLTIMNTEGGGTEYVPKCLGTLYYTIGDYGFTNNPLVPTQYDRTASLRIVNGDYPYLPSAAHGVIRFSLIKHDALEVLDDQVSWIVDFTNSTNEKAVTIYSQGVNNNGYSVSDASGSYFKLKSYQIFIGEDYYRLEALE